MSLAQSVISSALWPLGSVAVLASLPTPSPKQSAAPAPAPRPFASLTEHVMMQVGCIPRLVLVYLIYQHYGDWRTYGKTLSPAWVLPILLRDVGVCLFVGCVDSFLLLSQFSPFKARMAPHKYNPRYPNLLTRNGTSSLAREAFWCCVSACIAGLMEAGVVHASATGRLRAAYAGDAWWLDARTWLLMVTWFYSQNVQFYLLHRSLHAWGTTTVPDIGAFLYKHVHSLHHDSKSPTAFSGISMHPLESTLYFSYALFPLLFGGHLVAFLYIKLNLISAAMLCVRGQGWNVCPSCGRGARP